MSRLLITGGFGYIGSHTLVELMQAGFHDLVVVDDLRRSDELMVTGVATITGITVVHERRDVTDPVALAQIFSTHGPIDAVLHFAAYKSVRESVAHPLRYFRNNVVGMVSLLEAMQAYGCSRLLFSSSCTVYGQADALPVTESAPERRAQSPYGATKQMGERMMADAMGELLTHAVSLRYFNPAGAHASALIGDLESGEPDSLVPYITQTAAGWRPHLRVFGSDYNTPDGTPVRDYLHVVDLARAHVAAVRYLLEGPQSREVINLGSGHGYSVLDAIGAFEHATGITIAYEMAPRRAGDVEQIWSSGDKALSMLGWRTEHTLEEIMASAWAWQQTQPKPLSPGSPLSPSG